MRQPIVDRIIQQRWMQRRTADTAGVSVRTVAHWMDRSRASHRLLDGSSLPHGSPRRLSGERTTQILTLQQPRARSWEISARLGMPRSTVTRVLAEPV